MARYVFFTWSGAGNQPPAIGMAQALARRGHDIVFAGYSSQQELFVQHGFRFVCLQRAAKQWSQTFADNPREALVGAAWASVAHLTDVPELLSSIDPDVAIIDCFMFGVLAAIERTDLPAAVLAHSAPGAIMPPQGRLQTLLFDPVNQVRRSAGCHSIENMWEAWMPFLTLCTTIPELDPLAAQVPREFQYVGPVFEDFSASDWRSPWEAGDCRPLVLVSFHSGDDWDQSSRIERTLQALADLPCRVLVTKGKARVNTVPSNAIVVDRLPHRAVLPHVSATITHAGHGTVAASLAHGVPLVCLPNLAADQPELAAQIELLGVGRSLNGETATSGEIRSALNDILTNLTYRTNAQRLAAVFASAPGLSVVVDELERLSGIKPASEERRSVIEMG